MTMPHQTGYAPGPNEFHGVDLERLLHNMTNQSLSDRAVNRVESLRSKFKTLGAYMLECCPPSRERSEALTQLEGALMWAVASIARNQHQTQVRDVQT